MYSREKSEYDFITKRAVDKIKESYKEFNKFAGNYRERFEILTTKQKFEELKEKETTLGADLVIKTDQEISISHLGYSKNEEDNGKFVYWKHLTKHQTLSNSLHPK